MKEEEIKKRVRDRYAAAAARGASCGQTAGCCGGGRGVESISKKVGYSRRALPI